MDHRVKPGGGEGNLSLFDNLGWQLAVALRERIGLRPTPLIPA